MAILTPPATFCGPLLTSFVLAPLTSISPVSSFNNRSTVGEPESEFWRASITIPGRRAGTLTEPGWRDTAAFLMGLRGGLNTARIYDARRNPIRGAGGPFPTISLDASATAGATSISVKGLTPSQLVALAADDHFGIGENLYTVMAHCGSDVTGRATISFLPPLRNGVAEDDSINLSKPTAKMRLVGGFQDMSVPFFGRTAPMVLEFFEDPEFDT
jgi:hypothetical protein